jgi:hypothetical protein
MTVLSKVTAIYNQTSQSTSVLIHVCHCVELHCHFNRYQHPKLRRISEGQFGLHFHGCAERYHAGWTDRAEHLNKAEHWLYLRPTANPCERRASGPATCCSSHIHCGSYVRTGSDCDRTDTHMRNHRSGDGHWEVERHSDECSKLHPEWLNGLLGNEGRVR